MRLLIITYLSILSCFVVKAKGYDLVVTSAGDSIACHIDSITENMLYLEMKSNKQWIHTHIAISNIETYDFGTIKKNDVRFKPNSSIIDNKEQTPFLNKNSLYTSFLISGELAAIQLNYERLFYSNTASFITEARIRLGGGPWVAWSSYGPVYFVGLSTLTGEENHHAEFNISVESFYDKSEYNYAISHGSGNKSDFIYTSLVGGIGYRYQPNKAGFIFRLGVNLYSHEHFTASGYLSLGARF